VQMNHNITILSDGDDTLRKLRVCPTFYT